jgi:hypothetical protein
MLPLIRPSCVAACSAMRLLPPPETKTASLAGERPPPLVSGGDSLGAADPSSAEAAADAAVGAAAALAAADASAAASVMRALRVWRAGSLATA